MRGGKGVRILAAALLLVEAVVAVSPFAAGLRTPWSSPAVSEKSAWRSWRIGGSDDKDEVVRLRGLLTVAESEVASLSDELLDARAAQVRANTSLKAKDEKVRGYRQIIMRLKEEFIKAEEQRAVEIAKLRQQGGGATTRMAVATTPVRRAALGKPLLATPTPSMA